MIVQEQPAPGLCISDLGALPSSAPPPLTTACTWGPRATSQISPLSLRQASLPRARPPASIEPASPRRDWKEGLAVGRSDDGTRAPKRPRETWSSVCRGAWPLSRGRGHCQRADGWRGHPQPRPPTGPMTGRDIPQPRPPTALPTHSTNDRRGHRTAPPTPPPSTGHT